MTIAFQCKNRIQFLRAFLFVSIFLLRNNRPVTVSYVMSGSQSQIGWHGTLDILDSTTIICTNLISCYRHEIKFHFQEEAVFIVSCRSTWHHVHVLFSNGSFISFPWARVLIDKKEIKYCTVPNVCTEECRSSISTSNIDSIERFSHLLLNCLIEQCKSSKTVDSSQCARFLMDCTDDSAYIVDNECEKALIFHLEGQNFLPYTELEPSIKIVQISCGKAHTILLDSFGRVHTFGVGTKGELGHGNIECLQMPKIIEALIGLSIKQISAGGWHSAALTNFGDLYLWGWNNNGQLGINKEQVAVSSEPTFIAVDVSDDCSVDIDRVVCSTIFTLAITAKNEFYVSGSYRFDPNEDLQEVSRFTKLNIKS